MSGKGGKRIVPKKACRQCVLTPGRWRVQGKVVPCPKCGGKKQVRRK